VVTLLFDQQKIKKILYTFGKSLGVIGLVYILYKLQQEYTVKDFMARIDDTKSIIFYLFILNIVSNLIGIFGWHKLICHFAKNCFIKSYYYYEKTDISKYLPGNIFHLVGRQALASKLHLSQLEMAKIATIHTIMILIATIIASTLFALFSSDIHIYIKSILVSSAVGAIGILFFIFPSFTVLKKLKITSLFTLSIAIQGMMLAIIIAYSLHDWSISLFLKVASIYIISWLIGFVTPGASGGLGVREGAFIAILKFIHFNLPTDIVIFAILLIRLINIFSDICMYLLTYFVGKQKIA